MAASIQLHGVTLDYPIYSVRAQSLRNAMLNVAVGGRLMKTNADMTIVRALSNVGFKLEQGDRLGILGHNGSGKTSMLKVLAGVYEPTQGRVEISGRISSMLSMSIGIDPEASGLQNMRTLAMMQMMTNKEIDRRLPEFVEFSELGNFVHMPFKTYSAGMMARMTFAVATATGADILLMDEWIGAGDAAFQEKASARLNAVVESSGIVVLATHDPGLVSKVCNKVLVLDAGRQVFFGLLEDWQAQSAAA
jgi:lipopolysaccharide transport system ATP-binding protein